jgi:membrane protease YdiL (CAAX protease family)
MTLVGLGAFGPALAAMVAARAEGSGVGALLRPLGRFRVGFGWYPVALFLPGAIFVAAAGAYDALGHTEPLFYPPATPAYVAAAVVFPIGEEIGWRGFALPRLCDRFGALRASAIVGVFWMLWHLPMLELQGLSPGLCLVYLPYMVAGSVFFTWLYVRTRGSLLLAVLAHVGTHLDNPGHALPARSTPFILHALAYVVLAVGLLIGDRRAFATGPRPNAARRRGESVPSMAGL